MDPRPGSGGRISSNKTAQRTTASRPSRTPGEARRPEPIGDDIAAIEFMVRSGG
jgi:hypothetical protein